MTVSRGQAPRPMRVMVAPGSKAEAFCRKYRTTVHAGPIPLPQAEAIAPGFSPRPELNLSDHGRKIILDMGCINLFLGGPASWDPSDINNIDRHLSAAMADKRLNNVLVQYFRSTFSQITTGFRPSKMLPDPLPASISQTDIEQLIINLKADHNSPLNQAWDPSSWVVNFVLPRGVVLTIDSDQDDEARDHSGKGTAKPPHDVDDKTSSLEGLAGIHGSIKIDVPGIPLDPFRYTVGVFSEGGNGIVAFDQPWKNIVATFYHLLNEARTDPDSEEGGADLRVVSWGDGSQVPTSGYDLVIVGIDDNGLLHIRIFDQNRFRILEGVETNFPATQAGAISTLKQQLPGLSPPHVLTNAEKAGVLSEVISITGVTQDNFDSPAWVNARGEEIGDIPLALAGADLSKVMKEVPLIDGSGTVPIQLMWSNAVNGPEGPIGQAHPGQPPT